MPRFEGDLQAAAGARIALVASRWNAGVMDALIAGAQRTLSVHGVAEDAIDVVRVPGAWELPLACAWLAERGAHAALVALGCVVRGETRHYEHVADICAQGLARVALDHDLPVANGVLAVERLEDALARADGVLGNKGEEAALAALEMVGLRQVLA
jgi:6,7-dimethyl-8-ribityllumazine synthase